MIEDGKPVGVVLTMEEYELLRSKSSSFAKAMEDKQTNPEIIPSQSVASADLADITSADDITLEDLGLDELPY